MSSAPDLSAPPSTPIVPESPSLGEPPVGVLATPSPTPIPPQPRPARQISLRVVIALLVVIMLLIAGAYAGYLYYQSQQNPPPTVISISSAGIGPIDTSPTTSLLPPLTSLDPLIKPCLYFMYHSCAEALTANGQPDTSADKEYANKVEQDVYAALGKVPSKALITARIPLTKDQVTLLFPEYVADAKNGEVQVPPVLVLRRIAAKYDINPRVFLILMEVLNRGSGPLFSSSADLTQPFFIDAEPAGFVPQLLAVGEELKALQTKYALQKMENRPLPTELTFFDKKYSVATSNTPESLALIEFLANHMKSKPSFERAVFPVDSSNTDPQLQVQNFITLYKFVFGVDPR